MPSKVDAARFLEDAYAATKANWQELQKRCQSLFNNVPDPLYCLPESLIESIAKEGQGVCTRDELDFELELADAAQAEYAIGVTRGTLMRSNLLTQRKAMTVSQAEFDALKWRECGLNLSEVNENAAEAELRVGEFHKQLTGYAGWLVTNLVFLRDVVRLRESAPTFEPVFADQKKNVTYLNNPVVLAFLGKWQLAQMASWDLPEPQGPSLSGIPLPAAARRPSDSVAIELPLTVRLPGRFPIRDVVTEIRKAADQPHLSEWHNVLDQDKSAKGLGIERYAQMLHLQFFRNIVFTSRYSDRFKGNVKPLDRAFARYMDLEEQSAQKLRLELERRLAPAGEGSDREV
jgi:hypothetical protein